MAPTLRHGDHLVVWLVRPRWPRAGSLLLLDLPGRGLVIKRLRDVRPDGSLWVEGDNPPGSTDSRQLGALPPDAARGRVLARLWPRPGLLVRSAGSVGPHEV